ncbi:MAG: hypothetical protein ACOX1G_08000 [bacterium]|jgi:hypothetical protein|nr:hypothetical protein [bacterium]
MHENRLLIGWGRADITPDKPVLISGQFHARVSEGVADAITATVLVLQLEREHLVMVSCDCVCIPDVLRDDVRLRLAAIHPDIDPMKVVLHATHTHTGPEFRVECPFSETGIDLDVMPIEEYVHFATERIVEAAAKAWETRVPGKIAFGQGYAVIGHNRRWVDVDGNSTMYGNTDTSLFSHIEGYEDHSIGVLATRNLKGVLTGLVINVPCPSQVSEEEYLLSADYWCETRAELRHRFGEDLFILAQCSAAGDQSPHIIFNRLAEERMLRLKKCTLRQEIALRIADAVTTVLNCLETEFDDAPVLMHHVEMVDLALNVLTKSDAEFARMEADKFSKQYRKAKKELEINPEIREKPRWYFAVTYAYRRMKWYQGVVERFEAQKRQKKLPVEIHVIRLGEVVFTTTPFEYYLDFGIYIKARSQAVQTFLIQLAGQGTYVPSQRSVLGGGYGSVPASNHVGPEGGRQLAQTIAMVIRNLWSDNKDYSVPQKFGQ